MDIIGQGSLLGLKWTAKTEKPAVKKAQDAPKPGSNSALTEDINIKHLVKQAEKIEQANLVDLVWSDLVDSFNKTLEAAENPSEDVQVLNSDTLSNQASDEVLTLTQFAELLQLSRNSYRRAS